MIAKLQRAIVKMPKLKAFKAIIQECAELHKQANVQIKELKTVGGCSSVAGSSVQGD